MAAGGIPTVQVLLDDGTGTFPFDITTKTRVAYSISRGRADEAAAVNPGGLTLTLENDDGRFTLGSTIIASPSPIKVDTRIRVKVTPGANLLTADQASFETATGGFAFNALLGARDLGTSIAQSALHPTDGTKSLLLTWSTTVKGNTALISVPTVAGLTYTLSMDVYVPSGSPDVRATVAFVANGATVSTKDTTVRTSVTWTASGATSQVGVECLSATAGQQCFLDSLALNLAPVALPFAAGGLTLTRHTGYTQSWPVAWPSGSDLESTVVITATDAQARGERTSLRSVMQQEAEARLAFAHYALGEPSGAASASDSSGNQYPELVNLTSTTVTFGAGTGPPTDALPSPTFSSTAALTSFWPTPSGTGWSCVVFFNSAGPVSGIDAMKFVTLTNGPGAFTKINLTGTGGLLIQAPATGVGTFGSGRNDSKWHAVGISVNGAGAYTVMVDGATAGTGTVASLAGVPSGVQLGDAIGAGAGTGLGDQVGFIGGLAHLMLFNTTLTAADMIALAQAGTTGFAGESGTARITRLAGYVNLPVGTLDASLTNVAFADTTGKSASAAIRDVADAEAGLVFYDGSGNLTFHNRNRPAAKTAPDITITADALDPGTAFIVDMQGAANYLETTAAGTKVTQVVRNTTSETTHGRYPGNATTYLVLTDAEALDRANWIVANHAEPLPRVGSLVIDMLTQDAATQAALLAAEPNTWIRVTGLPAQTPGGTTADLVVQGFADVLARDSWAITFNVVNRSLFTAFILDSATYGVLDANRLYV